MDTIKFERGPAQDGIHDYITCNDYTPERWITVGQLIGGSFVTVGLLAAYAFVAWLEG